MFMAVLRFPSANLAWNNSDGPEHAGGSAATAASVKVKQQRVDADF
ncbi:MAG: hypothetical protein O2968_10365 [Acidobacteria bacterium]|nr:hypothetical protein [Acidobacteriota bacterium]